MLFDKPKDLDEFLDLIFYWKRFIKEMEVQGVIISNDTVTRLFQNWSFNFLYYPKSPFWDFSETHYYTEDRGLLSIDFSKITHLYFPFLAAPSFGFRNKVTHFYSNFCGLNPSELKRFFPSLQYARCAYFPYREREEPFQIQTLFCGEVVRVYCEELEQYLPTELVGSQGSFVRAPLDSPLFF